MSIASLKNILFSYSPVSEAEKESNVPLHYGQDLESMGSQPVDKGTEQKGSRIINGRIVSDAIIGLSDGMTVPFALTAGLSAFDDTKVVVFGGMAEIVAGSISMGLGGYLGTKSEAESYKATLRETHNQITSDTPSISDTISDIFSPYDLPHDLLSTLTQHLSASPKLDTFLMNFHHTLQEPSGSRPFVCALTIALGYFLGGFIPLLPYFFVGPGDAFIALRWSIATMVIALFVFGYAKTGIVCGWKGSVNVRKAFAAALEMVVTGGLAAACAMGLVRGFQALAEMQSAKGS